MCVCEPWLGKEPQPTPPTRLYSGRLQRVTCATTALTSKLYGGTTNHSRSLPISYIPTCIAIHPEVKRVEASNSTKLYGGMLMVVVCRTLLVGANMLTPKLYAGMTKHWDCRSINLQTKFLYRHVWRRIHRFRCIGTWNSNTTKLYDDMLMMAVWHTYVWRFHVR